MANADLDLMPIREGVTDLVERNIDLLRFTTAGSVDDGKSTLIGRLLYDSKSVYEDQLSSVRKSGINRSSGPIDLSLFTDGLRAEREQGITIDVAYRYFSTPRRKFIIADTPGHEQYTRNMATGASMADAAVILLDATKGLLPQSRRHTFIASLLGIKHVIAAVNKMDLVDYQEPVFEKIVDDFRQFAAQLGISDVYAVPASALEGDNIVYRSINMPWFTGSTLLEYLETLQVDRTETFGALRFPIQYVIRPDSRFRGFAGQVASGVLHPGDQVTALPSGQKTRIKSIVTFDGDLDQAGPGSSITVALEDEIDLSRGDLLVGRDTAPQISANFSAMLVWMHADALQPGKLYFLKHTTRTIRARVTGIRYRVDVNTLQHSTAATLQMNEIAAVEIEATHPLFFDNYHQNRMMGSFILIDPINNATIAAGMIEEIAEASENAQASNRQERVSAQERVLRNGHPPSAICIVGRKELAEQLERAIFNKGWQGQLISSDDFQTNELVAIAKVLQASGSIAIFYAPEGKLAGAAGIASVYGEESLLRSESLSEEDAQAVGETLTWLQVRKQDSARSGEQI